jgi:diguanylate cyclase (GGDEF)-like protein
MRLLRGIARRRVGTKFAAAVGAVALGLLTVAGSGLVGLRDLQDDIDRLVEGDLATNRAVSDLTVALYETQTVALWLAARPSPGLATALDQTQLPKVEQDLQVVAGLTSSEEARRTLAEIRSDLAGYRGLRRMPGGGSTTEVSTLFGRMTAAAQELRSARYVAGEASGREARATYARTRAWLLAGTLVSLLLALAVVQVVVRSLVPRIRHYSRFAGQVAEGRPVEPLAVRGTDELADLGRALNSMVALTGLARRREAEQAEFADTLQVTATEEEAHDLVQRHLERSLTGSSAVVLSRNNSENRLYAATEPPPGSPLASRLVGAEPRSCLALRFGRTHTEQPERPPLLGCTLCAAGDIRSTCEPLLVGGQVIGSVLVAYAEPLAPADEARIRNSVAQAAPVLANLRNLALAEFRANNDSLTGLPNKRATEDTLKRMVAQANRSITPLAAAMLDLDHFKQVNDRYGHPKGDEVLAAVGATLRSALRASDFAGRFGGEELLVLLPDTTAEGAVALAERLRAAIAQIRVPGVDRDITVSIGVADLIQHGGDAPGLLRQADRALYAAKATGRNRVVVAAADPDPAARPDRDTGPTAPGTDGAPPPAARGANGSGPANGGPVAGGAGGPEGERQGAGATRAERAPA